MVGCELDRLEGGKGMVSGRWTISEKEVYLKIGDVWRDKEIMLFISIFDDMANLYPGN